MQLQHTLLSPNAPQLEPWARALMLTYEDVLQETPVKTATSAHLGAMPRSETAVYTCTCMNLCMFVQYVDDRSGLVQQAREDAQNCIDTSVGNLIWIHSSIHSCKVVRPLSLGCKFGNVVITSRCTRPNLESHLAPLRPSRTDSSSTTTSTRSNHGTSESTTPTSLAATAGAVWTGNASPPLSPADTSSTTASVAISQPYLGSVSAVRSSHQSQTRMNGGGQGTVGHAVSTAWSALYCGCCLDTFSLNCVETGLSILAPTLRTYRAALAEALSSHHSDRYFPELGLLMPIDYAHFEQSFMSLPEASASKLMQDVHSSLRPGSESAQELTRALEATLTRFQHSLLPSLPADFVDSSTVCDPADHTNSDGSAHPAHAIARSESITAMLSSLAQPMVQGLLRSRRLTLALHFLKYRVATITTEDFHAGSAVDVYIRRPNRQLMKFVSHNHAYQHEASTTLSPLHTQRTESEVLHLGDLTLPSPKTTHGSLYAHTDFSNKHLSSRALFAEADPLPKEKRGILGPGLLTQDGSASDHTEEDADDESVSSNGSKTEREDDFEDVFALFSVEGGDVAQNARYAKQQQPRKKISNKSAAQPRRATTSSRRRPSSSTNTMDQEGSGLKEVPDELMATIMARSVAVPLPTILQKSLLVRQEVGAEDVASNLRTSDACDATNKHSPQLFDQNIVSPVGVNKSSDRSSPSGSVSTGGTQAATVQKRPASRVTAFPPPDLNTAKLLNAASPTELDEEQLNRMIMDPTNGYPTTDSDNVAALSDLTGSDVERSISGLNTNEPNELDSETSKSKDYKRKPVTTLSSNVSELGVFATSLSSAADASILTAGIPMIADLEAVTDVSFDPQAMDTTNRGRERSSTRTSLDMRTQAHKHSITQGGQQLVLLNNNMNPANISPTSPFAALSGTTSPIPPGLDIDPSAVSRSVSAVNSQERTPTPVRVSKPFELPPSTRRAESDEEIEVDAGEEDDYPEGASDEGSDFAGPPPLTGPSYQNEAAPAVVSTERVEFQYDWVETNELGDDEIYVDQLANRLGARGMTPPFAPFTDLPPTEQTQLSAQASVGVVIQGKLAEERKSRDLAPIAMGIGAEIAAADEQSENVAIARTLLMHGASVVAMMTARQKESAQQQARASLPPLEFEIEDVPCRPRENSQPSSLRRALSISEIISTTQPATTVLATPTSSSTVSVSLTTPVSTSARSLLPLSRGFARTMEPLPESDSITDEHTEC